MYIYLFILGAFVVSCVCGFAFIPAILKFCKEKQLYDLPDTRKRHKTAVPRLGGISFMPSMFISFVLSMLALCLMEGRGVKVSLASLYMLPDLLHIATNKETWWQVLDGNATVI